MKRLLKSETLTAVISVIATIVSILAIGSEFINYLPSISGLLVSIFGVILGAGISVFVLSILSKKDSAKVFISYSLKDNDFVLKLSNDLSRAGFQVLRLDNVVMVGDNIQDKINESIQKADFFVAVMSKESLESDWVLRELEIAAKSKKKIFPVLKENVPLPPLMESIQYADFTKEYDSAILSLAKSLRASTRSRKAESVKQNSA
ncbi:MAG: TIR domain-containing protein [Chloroflexi bacterium]|nr:TIR domain-containing protein [Chloroflexota bacterium]